MVTSSETSAQQVTAGESLAQPSEPMLDQASDLQYIFRGTLDGVVEIVGSRPTSSIYLVDEKLGELVLGMQRGVLETAEGRRGRTRLDESWMGLVVKQGEPRLIQDLGADPETSLWSKDIGLFRSAVIVTLRSQEQIIGIISVLDLAPGAFSPETLQRLSEVGKLLEISIENAILKRLQAKAQTLSNAILNSMADGVVVIDDENRIIMMNPVMESLKENPRTEKIPVIVLSIVQSDDEALHLGAVDYVVKPFSEERPLESVAKVLAEGQIKRVLVADDEPSIVRLLKSILAEHGYDTIVAVDGEEALSKARQENPDLVLLDIEMPKMDGIYRTANPQKGPQHQAYPHRDYNGLPLKN